MKGEIKSRDELPNIIGFISQTEKTGVLKLSSKGDEIEVGFIKGFVNAAVYHRGGVQDLIKEYLVNSGKISQEDFKKVLDLNKQTRTSLESILINEKYVNEETLKDIITFKIQEIVDELFIWNEGAYEFIDDIIMYEKSRIQVRLNTQALMMEGMRRIDEWPNILNLLPNLDIYFKRIEGAEVPKNLGVEESRMLEIINPEKSLEELIRTSGLGKFLTYQSIYNLMKMNLITKTKKEVTESKVVTAKEKKKNLYISVAWAVIFSVIILSAAAGVFLSSPLKGLTGYETVRNRASDSYAADNIDYLVKIFFLENRRYPDSLDELVKKGWITKETAGKFVYMKVDNGYKLIIND